MNSLGGVLSYWHILYSIHPFQVNDQQNRLKNGAYVVNINNKHSEIAVRVLTLVGGRYFRTYSHLVYALKQNPPSSDLISHM